MNELDDIKHFKLFLEKNPDLSLLLEDRNKIIGTILASFDGRRGYLQKLVVDKKYRRRGIGNKLIDKAVKKLEKLGALYIPISCEAKNLPFFEKSGFKETDRVTVSKSRSTYPIK